MTIDGDGRERVHRVKLPKSVSFLLNWSRKYSLWMFQFGLACCSIEFIASAMPKHDIMRLGVIPFPASPRQVIFAKIETCPASPGGGQGNVLVQARWHDCVLDDVSQDAPA